MAGTDYNKKKVAELEELLKARGLPHTGKKAELVARLQEDDAKQTSAAKPSTSTADEDQIDWDDDEPVAPAPAPATTTSTSTTSKTASTIPAAAAVAAGGKGQVANPTKVPNQTIDTDPSKTDDLTIDPPAPTSDTATKEDGAEKKEEAPLPTDFTSGLQATSVDDEIAKRKARALKFGIEVDDEALKALERSKRFEGTGEGTNEVKGLDQALPERVRKARGVKRGRDDSKDTRPASKRRDSGRREARSGSRAQGKARGGAQLSEKDKLAAEARRKRFQ